jgi:hypothetical protein
MPTFIAMLRGINVSGHKIVKMEALRASFGAMGFGDVKTYVQSGNVASCELSVASKEGGSCALYVANFQSRAMFIRGCFLQHEKHQKQRVGVAEFT